MSKIIETLKTRAQMVAKKNVPETKAFSVEKSGHELTQQQLADIYFSATGKPKTSEPPVIIRVIERPRAASLIPWTVASIAFLITALSLFSTKRIFVDIKVIDEKSPYLADRLPQPSSGLLDAAGGRSDAPGPAGQDRLLAVQDFEFEGAAYLKSVKDRSGLTLVNSSVSPFARATLYLDPPLNLLQKKIVFYAKGANGGENVAVALKDRGNMQAFPKGKMYPFPGRLTTDWQKVEIGTQDMAKEFDPRNVTNLRFEFGSKDTENRPGDTVFIRDLRWISG